ncbi:carboxypeptidase-like regulatory domain-containing protein [Pedobacter sp. P26]|uniref:carboxypeptidase-like regulatory domain-containing protein n=1 Tax=Pedobacter sp. P26 TaxID=3423956 RepID=UPI003D67D1BA
MKINLLKISGLSVLFLLNSPAFSMNPVAKKSEGFSGPNVTFVHIHNRKVITGTVSDEKNLPIPGVGIKNISSGKTAVTDETGKFSIEANPNEVIRFSYVGYQNKDVTVGSEANISVKMLPAEANKLDEVVVIGYGSVKKQTLQVPLVW